MNSHPLSKKCVFGVLFSLLLLVGVSTARTSRHLPSHRSSRSLSVSHRASRASSRHSAYRHASERHVKSASRGRSGAAVVRVSEPRGQQEISSERTREIQEALVREHYLQGEPTGVWDQQTRDAMTRFQMDNGWQTKITPDSRALIKLGLGPRHVGLLNPDSAALTSPHELGVERPIPGGSMMPETRR